MLTFVVKVKELDQLETLLLAAKAVGLTPEFGVAPDERPRSRKATATRKRSIKRGKPKRYPAKMTVKLGKRPETGPPMLGRVHDALGKEFGDKPFVKRLAKAALRKRLPSAASGTGYITKLLDSGGLVAAQG